MPVADLVCVGLEIFTFVVYRIPTTDGTNLRVRVDDIYCYCL